MSIYSVSFGGYEIGERRKKTHAEAEAGNERKGAPTPDGDHRDVEGSVFGADLCDHYSF
jgi:hypothetical protein